MKAAYKGVGLILLTAALAAPTLVKAEDRDRDDRRGEDVKVRIYDRSSRDYHNWDDNEDRAYRHYMHQHRRKYIEFHGLNARDQRRYWQWRHQHANETFDRD